MLNDESDDEIHELLQHEAEDVHDQHKIILQRQFFEAVVRAASVTF